MYSKHAWALQHFASCPLAAAVAAAAALPHGGTNISASLVGLVGCLGGRNLMVFASLRVLRPTRASRRCDPPGARPPTGWTYIRHEQGSCRRPGPGLGKVGTGKAEEINYKVQNTSSSACMTPHILDASY